MSENKAQRRQNAPSESPYAFSDEERCPRTTKDGRPCRLRRAQTPLSQARGVRPGQRTVLEPACVGHLTREEKAVRKATQVALEERVAQIRRKQRPACWIWELPADRCDCPSGLPHDDETCRLTRFHDGRCGICGQDSGALITDHDHVDDRVRGYICQGCNRQEGRSDAPVFVAWRLRHAADIVGVRIRYAEVTAFPGRYDPVPYLRMPGYERHLSDPTLRDLLREQLVVRSPVNMLDDPTWCYTEGALHMGVSAEKHNEEIRRRVATLPEDLRALVPTGVVQ